MVCTGIDPDIMELGRLCKATIPAEEILKNIKFSTFNIIQIS